MAAHQTIHAPQQDAAVQLPNSRAHCSVHAMQNPVVRMKVTKNGIPLRVMMKKIQWRTFKLYLVNILCAMTDSHKFCFIRVVLSTTDSFIKFCAF